jgi:hypothetical protein
MEVRACYFLPVEYFHVVFIPQAEIFPIAYFVRCATPT